jgi:tripartite-type tricarboxylate transporter receptor subunit TctC
MAWVLKVLACLLIIASGVARARAESFPTRPVKIIVPSSPAGVTDIAARLVGERLSNLWGQPVIVENRPGGGGSIGVTAAARSAPDGYTLLMTTNGEFALAPVIKSKIPYDVKSDFVPLAMITNNPMIVVSSASSPYHTLQDVIKDAQSRPDQITWASPGVGTWNHMTGEWLWSAAGVKLVHVPYRGGGPAGAAVADGQTAIGLVAISSALPHLSGGRLRVLALTTDHRSDIDPSWPTVAESITPGFNSMQWVGLYVPAEVDQSIRNKIENDVLSILADSTIKRQFEKLGIEVIGASGTEALKQLQRDSEIAKEVSKKAHIHVE